MKLGFQDLEHLSNMFGTLFRTCCTGTPVSLVWHILQELYQTPEYHQCAQRLGEDPQICRSFGAEMQQEHFVKPDVNTLRLM